MTTLLKKSKTSNDDIETLADWSGGIFLGEYVFLESFKSHFCRQPPILFRGVINCIHYSFTFFPMDSI